MARVLTAAAIKAIEAAIEELFDRAKVRYLGPNVPVDKRIYIGVKPHLSLPGLFNGAGAAEGAIPDDKLLRVLIQQASSYLDSYKASAKAQLVNTVQSFLQQADAGGVKTNVKTILDGQISDVWGKVTNDIKRMIDTEATKARNVGVLDSIVKVNATQDIDDPVVFWVVVRDQYLCDECKKIHLLDDDVTPRVWRLSEVSHGYHKKGEDSPSIGGLHPHCRCTLVTLMPGYGFDTSGMVKYIKEGYDEFKEQRGLAKSQSDLADIPLQKSTREGLETFKKHVEPRVRKNAAKLQEVLGEKAQTVLNELHGSLEYRLKRLTHEREHPYPGADEIKLAEDRVNDTKAEIARMESVASGKVMDPRYMEMATTSPLTMNFPMKAAAKIMEAGRMKNLFETGTGQGSTDTDDRTGWEEDQGIPSGVPDHRRPLYGSLHIAHDNPKWRAYGGARSYGEAWLQLKPHVRQRATITPGDSSTLASQKEFHLPADDHEAIARMLMHHTYHSLGDYMPALAAKKPELGYGYLEAQIHGGVYPEDVESIHISPNQASTREQSVVELGKRWNVPVYRHRESGDSKTPVPMEILHHPMNQPPAPDPEQLEMPIMPKPEPKKMTGPGEIKRRSRAKKAS